jgi:DNA-binding NarL/FixJ family response regulator
MASDFQTNGGQSLLTLSTMSQGLSAVLLEDHPVYREGLKSYLKKEFPAIIIQYDGDDFMRAKDIVSKNRIDFAILDLHLGDGRSPSEIVSIFSSAHIPVLVISALNNFESVKSAFSMGATGFVSKDSSIDEIGRAIKAVLAGNEWISPTLSKALTMKSSASEQLSAQEKRAVILYASGLKLDVVARRMEVAPSTVKQYIDRAKMKYRANGISVRTKTDMYKILRDEGLID